ncbi:MAG: IS91 family transposase [Burkholderiales bacterium]|nr:IS91 family transposase [Burkholderiales bacterium]
MQSNGRIKLADILRTHGQAYLARHWLSASQAKAWRAIVACRTEALGGHVEQCDACGATHHVYHSCRNRHCPTCQTRAKEQWVRARQRELLPVPYTHLVFTIPHALNGLAARHFRLITELLFNASAATLLAFAANPRWLGGSIAFSLVLHTWNQRLERHLHVHALVANGALGADGRWIAGKSGFLFPVKALSTVFREKFMEALKLARLEQRISGETIDQQGWRKLLIALRKHDWVVYAKQPLGGPAQVLEYLSRYTHRVAISNERLVSLINDTVTFKVRDKDHPGKKKREQVPAETFIQRFLQHVLPPGFKRIRHYGILASCHKREKLAQCRLALHMPAPQAALIESVQAFMLRVQQLDLTRCRQCATGVMHLIAAIAPKRLWRQTPTGPPP